MMRFVSLVPPGLQLDRRSVLRGCRGGENTINTIAIGFSINTSVKLRRDRS